MKDERRASHEVERDVDMKEKLRNLISTTVQEDEAFSSCLEGFHRKIKGGAYDPHLRALIRIAADADLNILWRKKFEEILQQDEDLARFELKSKISERVDLKQLRSEGASEQEIELAAGHMGLRDDELYEEEMEYDQTLGFILKQADVMGDREKHHLLQEALKKLNMLSSYINLVTKNSDAFEDVLDKVLENTGEALTHAGESKTKLDTSAKTVQVELKNIRFAPHEGRKGSSTLSKLDPSNINPSFLRLASFSGFRTSFVNDQGLGSLYQEGSMYAQERKRSLGNVHGESLYSVGNGSFHGSMRGSRHLMRSASGNFRSASGQYTSASFNFHNSFHSVQSGIDPFGNNAEEKAAELGWKLLENGLRLYKFSRRHPKAGPKAKIFTLVEDQKLIWTGTKQQPLSVISADQELPNWLPYEKADIHPWIVKHFHGLNHFQENMIRLKVHNKQEDNWEMLLVARSHEIADSVLAVFQEEAVRKSIIGSVHEGGRRSSLAEMDGRQDRVHRRNSIDRLQTSERSKRSRNKVLIHQQGHSILKKANMPMIQEHKKVNPHVRTKKRDMQTRTKEERDFLFKVLQKNPIFSSMSKRALEECCGLMRKINITDGMELVHQGNFASNFYIVEEGQLACIIVEKNSKLKKKMTLMPEDHFGETSLILKSPLPFSVVSVKESTLWALDQETFSKIFSKNETLQKVVETLVEVTIFNSLDDALFSDMILKCKQVKFDPGEEIAVEEDFPGFFYVLQEGQVLVKNNWYASGNSPRKADNKLHKKLAIPGEFFGDFEICYGQTFTSTYTAGDEGATMLLISAAFFQKLKKNIEKAVAENLKTQVLHSLPTFASLDEREIFNVVSAFEFHKFKKGHVVIKKGATEDQFYFLKKGSCVVLDDIKRPQNIMTRVKGHGSFGELALLSDEPRSAWVVAESDIEVYSLRALQFNRLVKLVKEQSTKEHMIHVLQLIDLLNVLSTNDYKLLSDALVQEPFQGGDKVIEEGDANDKLHIVSRGEFLLTRKIAEGTATTERVRLLPGNYFGERALLASEKCNYSVTASRLSEVCTISRHVFEQYCGDLSNLLQVALKKSEEETKLLSLERKDFNEKGIIGRGSFGSVRLVQEKVSRKWYAMKCLIKKDIVDSNHQKNLKQEIQIMTWLEHEMIIRLKKKWQDERFIYLLTDVCSGGELYDEMQKHGKFDEARCKFYAACIVSILAHMRERKIVYRDLKPENVLIDSDGYLKLIDFGFAKKLAIGEKAHSFCGTPDYIAPEVLLNEGYSYSVDIWGLGVLVYEMIAGKTPFRIIPNSSNKVIMKNILNKKVSYPAESFAGISRDCVDFMKNCLKKEQLFRLGAKDVSEMKEHPWFSDFGQHGWNALERKLIKPPFIPQDTDPEKIRVKSAKTKELQVPPVVQDYELDTIFADDDLYGQMGVFPGAEDARMGRRRSSVHSVNSVESDRRASLTTMNSIARRRASVGSVGSVDSQTQSVR